MQGNTRSVKLQVYSCSEHNSCLWLSHRGHPTATSCSGFWQSVNMGLYPSMTVSLDSSPVPSLSLVRNVVLGMLQGSRSAGSSFWGQCVCAHLHWVLEKVTVLWSGSSGCPAPGSAQQKWKGQAAKQGSGISDRIWLRIAAPAHCPRGALRVPRLTLWCSKLFL